MELMEISHEETLRREAAAEKLRQLADSLSRHNGVELDDDGRRYTVKVPNEVTFSFEVELTDEGGEIEVEISW